MSRDWTPQQLWHVDRYLEKEKGGSLKDMNMIISYNGKEELMFSEQDMKLKKTYPHLTFLFDYALDLYKNAKDETKRDKVFLYLESELAHIIALDEAGESYSSENDTIVKWYEGKLSDYFYYNSENNNLFADYVRNLLQGGSE